ncbi:hypothetical protein CH249_16210 [Rhodococcus sp. 05-2255-3B1]|nr:hypothetical protein CH250_24275 [Rhodococcus sp. 05-2255-3C]OZE09692.1 hypothetical protein CH249_16210 [Rhodococcus sp. 05-2255-3B1]OZE14958.1 hypothetical protein CH255_22555 [Rhodococcus sp. 05-2255-2A2]
MRFIRRSTFVFLQLRAGFRVDWWSRRCLVVTRLSQLGLSNLFETSDLSIPLIENIVLKQVWQVGG